MNLIPIFLGLQSQLKICHWLTASYAQHVAFDKTYSDLDDLIDSFMESCMGIHGRPEVEEKFIINVRNYDKNTCIELFEVYTNILNTKVRSYYQENSDLLNIIDEMIGSLNKLKYLLTLS